MAVSWLIRSSRFMLRPHRRTGTLWVLLALLALVGCGASSGPVPSPGFPESYVIGFTPATTYDAALQMVTDLGLQPGFVCNVETAWQPMGQRVSFAAQHTLVVLPCGAPEDWMGQLAAVPGVVNIVNALAGYPDQPTPATTPTETATFSPFESAGSPTVAPYAYACPSISPPATQTPTTLTSSQAGAYARVAFTRPLTTYGDALAVAVNLGLRLADPCREESAGQGTPLPWQPKGQASAFSNTHALVVATVTLLTAPDWQRLLAQTPGVSGMQTPYAPTCS